MKHVLIMLAMVVLAIAVITTGLHQREQERKARQFERQQVVDDRGNVPININSNSSNTDPFGLFGPEEMVYKVTFTTQWTPERHGEYHLSTAHFSAPVVWVSSGNPVFTLGQKASTGIEEMAEEGRTRRIKQELETLLEEEKIVSFDIYERVETPANFSFEIELDRTNPIISLVSMVAPSPDWFVALEGLNMLEEGRWKKQEEIQLLVLDAGTEEGQNFRFGNEATKPQGVITELTDIPSRELPPFATVTLTQVGYSESE